MNIFKPTKTSSNVDKPNKNDADFNKIFFSIAFYQVTWVSYYSVSLFLYITSPPVIFTSYVPPDILGHINIDGFP